MEPVASARSALPAELEPPTPGHPYWRREGARLAFCEVIGSAAGGELAAARAIHTESVAEVLAASFAAAGAGDPLLSRALAIAAGRLCQETIGFWSAGSEAA